MRQQCHIRDHANRKSSILLWSLRLLLAVGARLRLRRVSKYPGFFEHRSLFLQWTSDSNTNLRTLCEHGLSLNRIIVSLESANCGCIILSEWWMQWNVTCKYEMKWGRDKNTYGGKDEKWMNSIVSLVRVILSFIYVAGTRDRLGYYYNMHDMNMQIQYVPLAS